MAANDLGEHTRATTLTHPRKGPGAAALALFGSCCALLASPSSAAPITFLYTGTASGSVDGSSFTDRDFTVTFNGDTSNIRIHPVNPNIRELPISSATILIVGFPTATIETPTILTVSPIAPDLSSPWQLYPQTDPPSPG